MSKRIRLVFTIIFLSFTMFLYGCMNNSIQDKKISSNKTSNNNSNSSSANEIPVILYTATATDNITAAVKTEYNIRTKKLDTGFNKIFNIKNEYNGDYQWNEENKLFISLDANEVSTNFVVKSPFSKGHLTQNYEIQGTNYKVYDDTQGIILEEISNNKNQSLKINLVKENKSSQSFNPLLLYKNGKDILILVHFYHPNEDNVLISGLYLIKVSGEKVTIDNIDLKDQPCINFHMQPVLIGDNIFANTYESLGSISTSKKNYTSLSFFDNLIKDINSVSDDENSYIYQPVIGKIGDLLLLSYGTGSYNNIWGIRNEEVVFKIYTSGKDIFDEVGNKIGTTDGDIERVLLPSW